MKVTEISGKSEKELKELLKDKKNDLFNLNLDLKQNKLKNTRSIYSLRKDIARVSTLIREKELSGAKEALTETT